MWSIFKQKRNRKCNSSILRHFKKLWKCQLVNKSSFTCFLGHLMVPPTPVISILHFICRNSNIRQLLQFLILQLVSIDCLWIHWQYSLFELNQKWRLRCMLLNNDKFSLDWQDRRVEVQMSPPPLMYHYTIALFKTEIFDMLLEFIRRKNIWFWDHPVVMH